MFFWLLLLVAFPTWAKEASTHPFSDNASQTDVIIVGAGMSGIMAAKTLSDNNVTNFLILEATDKIGGRMRTETFGGYTVELGANWVEGVGGKVENPIWKLAKEYDLRVIYTDYANISHNIYSQEGKLLPQSIVATPFRLGTASYNYCGTLSKSLHRHGGEDISILCSQRLFGHIPSTPLEMLIDFFNYDFETAEPPRVTSLKNVQPIQTFEIFGEDEYFVVDERGYVYILDQLAKKFLKTDGKIINDPRVKTNKVVNGIEYSSHGVKISTEDGSTYSAKFAISSVSLGVLQQKLIKFKPDLPPWKIKTFYQFDMCIFTKIFLKFPRRFWPSGPGMDYFLYAHEKRGYYPYWQSLENAYPGSNILFTTVTDDESRRIEQQPDYETKKEAMDVLRKMFGEDIPDAESILVPRWWTNRFYGGSYINWPIGVTEANFDCMKAPIGNLYFTGEHTIEKFNGYVHGAYLAGIATANTLLDCIFRNKCDELPSDAYPSKLSNKSVECCI